ncbi:Parvovirus coat protein VP1-like protein [Cytobacillus spongiae]|uniref:Parvovirus coat protein VP1-like protein n=1 Tax=Cytobacillus spongiae TaxID=2901381 RepID=UPI001F1D9CFC|nr:Parvovirus coat protein VP1-like protein [Cytobacillus spongiae]UII54208.1 Parvovirus coat protein VP1-like protein [Cytobacillus spongiae]
MRGRGICLRGYRWCGPGCSGPGAPTNGVDSCCKLHDECYRKYGRANPYCDTLFINCLKPKMNRHSKQGRDAALFANLIQLRRNLRLY